MGFISGGRATVVRLTLLGCALLALTVSPAAAARSDNKSKPVLFVHGLFRGDMNQSPPWAVDCWGRFDKATGKLRQLGYTGRFDLIKYYAYDFNCGYRDYAKPGILGCGDTGCDDPAAPSITNISTAGEPGVHYHSVASHCPIGEEPCPPGGEATPYPHGGHNSNAPLQHVAYHLAWYIYERYSSQGKAVDVVGGSMSGMPVRYAIAQTERHHPDFPPYLKVEDVVMFAAPHGGAQKPSFDCTYVQCTQMGWPKSTLGFEEADEALMLQWMQVNAWEPDGKGGTDWTDMGSDADTFVLPWNAVGTNTERTQKTTFGGCHKLWYRATDTVQLGHGDFSKDSSDAFNAPVWKEPKGTCTGKLVYKPAYYHPLRAMARALYGGSR